MNDSFVYCQQGMFQLFVNVIDIDTPIRSDLIANIFIDLILVPSATFTSTQDYGTGSGGSIRLQFKVECDDNLYGHDCGTFCVDSDDSSGHFTCGSNGERICLSGWSDPTTNCITRMFQRRKCEVTFCNFTFLKRSQSIWTSKCKHCTKFFGINEPEYA